MSEDKLEQRFDKMLRKALCRHSEPVPPDFTARMLSRVRAAEQRRILARMVLRARLTVIGCALSGIIAVILVSVFPGVALSFTDRVVFFADEVAETIAAISHGWQLYALLAAALGFAAYALMDLLAGDS